MGLTCETFYRVSLQNNSIAAAVSKQFHVIFSELSEQFTAGYIQPPAGPSKRRWHLCTWSSGMSIWGSTWVVYIATPTDRDFIQRGYQWLMGFCH
jgi:hypothetical protein